VKDIAVYIQGGYAKSSYAVDSYCTRWWFGMELVKHVIEKAGFEVGYAGMETVSDYKVLLVPITSQCDWWSFLAERLRWKGRQPRVIVGGHGVCNVRALLPFFDVAVYGRAENLIVPLIEAELSGGRFEHESICYSDSFSMDRKYIYAQVGQSYPEPFKDAKGNECTEGAIGCQRKCSFCHYTWTRKYLGQRQSSGKTGNNPFSLDQEFTLFDFDLKNSDDYPRYIRNVGLDGASERLRVMVNKPISNEMLYDFLMGLTRSAIRHPVRVYNLIGLPTETDDDIRELSVICKKAAVDAVGNGCQRTDVQFHFTPFRAMPATPSGIWKMSYKNHRDDVEKMGGAVRQHVALGEHLRVTVGGIVESLSAIFLEAIVLRGVESDSAKGEKLALAKKFWSEGNSTRRLAALETLFDKDRLFKQYTWDDLPARNVWGYLPEVGIKRLSERGLVK